MEFKHIEYFVETSRHTSMSKTVGARHIPQQVLSCCIANMDASSVQVTYDVMNMMQGNPSNERCIVWQLRCDLLCHFDCFDLQYRICLMWYEEQI